MEYIEWERINLATALVYLAISGAAAFVLGRILPKRLFHSDRFPYRSFAFEHEGKIYNKLKISAWQSRVPDMSRLFQHVMPVKRFRGRPTDAQLLRMIQETCVAEFIHILLCITGLYILKLSPDFWGCGLYVVYVLLGNLSFILIQRYNRPRLMLLRKKNRERAERLRIGRGKQNVLILSCNTGEGHNSCARAIQEAFDAHGVACHVADALEFVSPSVSRFMAWGHVFVYRRIPRLFRFGYRFSEKHPGVFAERSPARRLLELGVEALASYIVDGSYSAVITTHVFSALMLTTVQRQYKFEIKTSFVATDYTCSPSTEMSELDAYFVPDASLIREFNTGRITKDRIVDCGIPVRKQIYQHTEKALAKRRVGLPENCRHLLVMCGSMGCGPLKWVMLLLSIELEKNQYITLVCGTNKKLKRKMERRYARNPHIRVLGYEKNISLLMDSADLYLTKPGGLSVTEAAIKNLPMVMINTVAGCEEYNKDFYVKLGLGVSAENSWSLTRLCRDVFNDDARLEQMRSAGRQKQWKNASELIYGWTMGKENELSAEGLGR